MIRQRQVAQWVPIQQPEAASVRPNGAYMTARAFNLRPIRPMKNLILKTRIIPVTTADTDEFIDKKKAALKPLFQFKNALKPCGGRCGRQRQ